MRNIEVKRGQSLFDIAIQECGNVEAAIAIAEQNNISLSATPTGLLLLPDDVEVNRPVAFRIKTSGVIPASDITGADMGGIGAMGIEIDFVVTGYYYKPVGNLWQEV